MSNRILTRAEYDAMTKAAVDQARQADKAQTTSVGTAAHYRYFPGDRCPLMPSTDHCWHATSVFWDGLFPPPLICCWCAVETFDLAAVPHRHGPHAPE